MLACERTPSRLRVSDIELKARVIMAWPGNGAPRRRAGAVDGGSEGNELRLEDLGLRLGPCSSIPRWFCLSAGVSHRAKLWEDLSKETAVHAIRSEQGLP